MSVEAPSPFPSPSSSFLTPPTPGAHEFALKPPSVRSMRKGSATPTSPGASPRSSVCTDSPSHPPTPVQVGGLAMGISPSSSSQQDDDKVFIKIRDFAFQPSDERHNGQGPLVPKTNRVRRMNHRLGGRPCSTSSVSSSDGDPVDEDDDGDGLGWNLGGYGARGFSYGGWGGGRFSWAMSSGTGAATAATIFDQEKVYAAAAANLSAAASKTNGNASEKHDVYPSRSDMDRNFLDSESEEYYDAEDDGVYDAEEGEGTFEDALAGSGDDEPLYPGLYRALYAFEPEGTAEMRLVEDQIVRVIGRGGGVGWAVVIAESEGRADDEDSIGDSALKATKHALVPESYLEPYKLDWEFNESGAGTNWRTA